MPCSKKWKACGTTFSATRGRTRDGMPQVLRVLAMQPSLQRTSLPWDSTGLRSQLRPRQADTLSLCNSSVNFRSLSRLASVSTGPIHNALPQAVTAHRTVMSTANWAPWFIGNPEAKTSIALSSVAGTLRFMSRNLVLILTEAARFTTPRGPRCVPWARPLNEVCRIGDNNHGPQMDPKFCHFF